MATGYRKMSRVELGPNNGSTKYAPASAPYTQRLAEVLIVALHAHSASGIEQSGQADSAVDEEAPGVDQFAQLTL